MENGQNDITNYYALRIGQLDCSVLDTEIVEQLWRKYLTLRDSLPDSLLSFARRLHKTEPELKLLLRAVTMVFPLVETGMTTSVS